MMRLLESIRAGLPLRDSRDPDPAPGKPIEVWAQAGKTVYLRRLTLVQACRLASDLVKAIEKATEAAAVAEPMEQGGE